MHGRKDGWMDGWMDGWIDGWIDGCIHGACMDGWMSGCINAWRRIALIVLNVLPEENYGTIYNFSSPVFFSSS